MIWVGHGMMPARICSAAVIDWASSSCAGACTTPGAIGRRRIGSGWRGWQWVQPAERVVVEDYLLAIDQLEARLWELDRQLGEIAETAPYREPVGWLRCFRGIDTLTAILILSELHDFRRFPSARGVDGLSRASCQASSRPASGTGGVASPRRATPRPPVAGGNGVALSTSPGLGAALARRRQGPAGAGDRHRRQSTTALVPALP